jgi:5'-nucleotidase
VKSTQILLTNDDGIQSPGLWAAAEVLSQLGFVHVMAPREQFSGAGRGYSKASDGLIVSQEIGVGGKQWTVYGIGGTPAETVLHALLEILPQVPDLVVSGINYGENVGTAVTTSGTVGAALEAASFGIPALAISLETDPAHHFSYSKEVDFSTAAYFTHYFGKMLLEKAMPADVSVLKVDVPIQARPDTPWEITRQSLQRYFIPIAPKRTSWDVSGKPGYEIRWDREKEAVDTDVYAIQVKKVVSVTPLSLDLTSRVNLKELEGLLRGKDK